MTELDALIWWRWRSAYQLYAEAEYLDDKIARAERFAFGFDNRARARWRIAYYEDFPHLAAARCAAY